MVLFCEQSRPRSKHRLHGGLSFSIIHLIYVRVSDARIESSAPCSFSFLTFCFLQAGHAVDFREMTDTSCELSGIFEEVGVADSLPELGDRRTTTPLTGAIF